MVKILAASDIHGDVGTVYKLVEKAEKYDVDAIVLAGDLTLADDFKGNIIGPFLKLGKEIMILGGNHDSFATIDFLSKMYNVKNLHGNYVIIGDTAFFGCGGANIGSFALDENEIEEILKKAHSRVSKVKNKVMITHVHPSGSRAEKMTTLFPGSSGVANFILKYSPNIHICGHVHEAEGLEEKIGNTKVYNVGEKGKIIDTSSFD